MAMRKPSRMRSPCPAIALVISSDSGPNDIERLLYCFLGNVLFGEVNSGFDQRSRLDNPLTPGLSPRAQHTFEVLERLPPLCFGFSRHQIGETFNRSQIHAAVLERTPRKLAGLRGPKLIEPAQRGKNRRDHGAAAVHLQLGEVLTGLAVRCRKPER